MDPEGPRIKIILGVVFFLLILTSAFFSISETAFSYCNRTRLRVRAEGGEKRAKAALKIKTKFDRALAALMIGNNAAQVAASAIATILFVGFLGVNLGAIAATAFTTVIVLLFCEAIPKNLAQQNADRLVLLIVYPIRAIMLVFTPLTFFFNGMFDLYRLVFRKEFKDDNHVSEDDISDIVEEAEEEGVIDEVEGEIIQNAIEFGDMAVKDVLTPAEKIVSIDVDETSGAILKKIAQRGYSRYPVTDGGIDNVVGMLHTRTYLKALHKNRKIRLADKILPPYIVSPTISLDDMFIGFREHKSHMAIVSDNGKTIGMVTMEDVLEELVGEESPETRDEEVKK